MPKVVDHDQRRAEIVQSARQLIGAHGGEALTLRRLADECGLANGALRRYFRFKDDVLLALDADIVQRFAQHAEREDYDSQRGVDAVRTLMNGMLPLDRERKVTAEVLAALRDHAAVDESVAEAFSNRIRRLFDQVVAHLKEARDDRQITGGRDIEVTAAILVNTVLGINLTATYGEELDVSRYDAAVVEAILASA
ncbi:TetR/AcrR family transcriptional regulator [Aeromicrobium sp. UC242_57]|uniref:TetR/AcrR family transcriptional regulator n=1 Tax=Aeromicrobium sp. UC242_57 TaxID=3374624 RepID=UPI0037A77A05